MKKIILGLVAAMTALGLQADGKFRVSGGDSVTYKGVTYDSVEDAHAALGEQFPLEYTSFLAFRNQFSSETEFIGPVTITLLADQTDNDNVAPTVPWSAHYILVGGDYTVSAENIMGYQISGPPNGKLEIISGKFTKKPDSKYIPKGYCVKEENGLYVVREGASYVMLLESATFSLSKELDSIDELASTIEMYKSYLPAANDLVLTIGQDVTITDKPFNFPGGKWKIVGGDQKVTGTVDGKQFVLSGGASVTFDSGIFQVNPRDVGTVVSGRYVKHAQGGFYMVSDDPTPVVSFTVDDEVIREATEKDSTYDTIAYTLEIAADPSNYGGYENYQVYVYLSNSLPVEVGTAAVGMKAGGSWQPDFEVRGDPSVKTLIPGVTLQQAVEYYGGKVSFVYKDVTGALMATGNTFTVQAVIRPVFGQSLFSAQKQYTFKHGYFGPAAPAGDPLPVSGQDVVGYFKFDDVQNLGANSGVSTSALDPSSARGISYTESGRDGGAIVLSSADSYVTGTIVSPHTWTAASDKYVDSDRARLPASDSWTAAFWYKPDPAGKPSAWDAAVSSGMLSEDFAGLYDGNWHHLVVTFNARRWIESSCPFEIYCDGGHWNYSITTNEVGGVIVTNKTDNGWTYSYHGSLSESGLPLEFNATNGTLKIGGNIMVHSVTAPLAGAIDNVLLMNRWVAPDDARGLYQTGDVYVYRVCDDVLNENGTLNAYKTWNGWGQLGSEYLNRGGWDSHIGWSTLMGENLGWQLTYPRDFVPTQPGNSPDGGYDVSYCDHLVDDGMVFMPVKSFGLSTVFMGASLTLGRVDGSTGNFYLYSGNGGHKEITVNDLRLNNGVIMTAAANAVTNLNGSATVNDDFAIVPDSTEPQKLVWSASLKGKDDVTLTIGRNDVDDDLTVKLAGVATEFVGTLDVTAGATLELPVAGESVEALTPYDGTQMKALTGEGWVKFVLADDVQLVEGTNLLAQLPKDAGIAARFTTNLESDENFEVSVEVVEEAAETQVFLVVKEVEQPTPPTPGEKPMVAEVFGGELVEGEGSTNCTLVVTDPEDGWTAKWAWSDTDECTNDAARAYSEAGVYTNIVKVTAEGYDDFYGTGVVTIVSAPQPPPVEPVTPGKEHQCETPQEAADLVQAINADKENRIKVPTCVKGGDVAIYLGYLKARVVDETKVVVDLDPDRKAELEAALDEAFTAESVAGLSDSTAPLTITGAIPGLYYWVEGGVELDAITENGEAQQAESEKTTLELAKPTLSETAKGFFKLAVGVAAP